MTLDIVVPGCEILVADRPINGNAFAPVGLEIEIAPTVAVPAPEEGAAADLVASVPVEAFDLGVG